MQFSARSNPAAATEPPAPDSIDLTLDNASRGVITFDSKAGRAEIDLAELTDENPRKTFDFGGLDMSVTIERYPQNPSDTSIHLQRTLLPPVQMTTPYFVK